MAMSLKESKKEVRIKKIHTCIYLSFGEKIVKIGPVDREIISQVKKRKINASKIYSPSSKFAERSWPN